MTANSGATSRGCAFFISGRLPEAVDIFLAADSATVTAYEETIMISNWIQKMMQPADPKGVIIKIICCTAALLILSGCVGFWIKPYGSLASDIAPIRADGQAVSLPENAPSISQGYRPAPYDPFNTEHVHNHTGIDIIGKKGTPVIAPASGVVTGSYFELMYGHHIEIDLGRDENGRQVKANFLHLKKRLVQKGENIARGQQIGTLGATGVLAGGFPHLHYEILVGAEQDVLEPINPHWLWANGVGIVTCFDRSKNWSATPLKTTYPVPCRDVNWQ
jgi:murein DD-endopeptidase MepM/ murein hydrolase activator NlpD